MTKSVGQADAIFDEPGRPATASAAGRVVLELGPGVGALVLYAPADLEGAGLGWPWALPFISRAVTKKL